MTPSEAGSETPKCIPQNTLEREETPLLMSLPTQPPPFISAWWGVALITDQKQLFLKEMTT